MGKEKLSYNPLYLQVKDVILKRIIDGEYPQACIIPSESKLADDFGTSISTIRQALSILVSEGHLLKKQGRGTFVSEKKVKITFLTWLAETERGKQLVDDVIRAFQQEHPSVDVEPIFTVYPETRDTLLRMITNGNAPDVAQIVSPWTSYFASMGAFEPLDELLPPENLKGRCMDKDLVAGRYRDIQYSVAWGLCPLSLVVNKNLWVASGLRDLKSPMTLTEFGGICGELSRQYKDRDKYCYGLNVLHDESDFFRIYNFLQAFGGGFVNDKGEVVFNSEENAEGFSWIKNFVNANKILKTDIYAIRKEFARGNIMFITDAPWIKYMMEELTGEPFDKNFKVILNPVGSTGTSLSWNYNHALAICSQSRNKICASRFVDAITRDGRIAGNYYKAGGHLPPYDDGWADEEFKTPFFTGFKKQLENATCLNASNPMFEKAMVLCMDAVRKILFEDVDIRKELDEKEYYLNMLYYG